MDIYDWKLSLPTNLLQNFWVFQIFYFQATPTFLLSWLLLLFLQVLIRLYQGEWSHHNYVLYCLFLLKICLNVLALDFMWFIKMQGSKQSNLNDMRYHLSLYLHNFSSWAYNYFDCFIPKVTFLYRFKIIFNYYIYKL